MPLAVCVNRQPRDRAVAHAATARVQVPEGPVEQLEARPQMRCVADARGQGLSLLHALADDGAFDAALGQVVVQDRYEFPASASREAARKLALSSATLRISSKRAGRSLSTFITFSTVNGIALPSR